MTAPDARAETTGERIVREWWRTGHTGPLIIREWWRVGGTGPLPGALGNLAARIATALRAVEDAGEQAVDAALEEAAVIADAHWPESGHVALKHLEPDGAVSCAMTISILIRRLKKHRRPETWHGRAEAAEARLAAVTAVAREMLAVIEARWQEEPTANDATSWRDLRIATWRAALGPRE